MIRTLEAVAGRGRAGFGIAATMWKIRILIVKLLKSCVWVVLAIT
jgi:hypothetical protein